MFLSSKSILTIHVNRCSKTNLLF